MHTGKTTTDSVLRHLGAGFTFIIALSWLTEVFRIPHLLFGEPAAFNWPRVLLRTAIILGIWGWLHATVKRVLKRLNRLERFLLVCSWCRKVGTDDQWLTMEEYFGSRFATETSHGICPACAAKLRPIPEPEPQA